MNSTMMLGSHVPVTLQDSWTVLGVKGSGKTTYIRAWLPSMWNFYPGLRTYILDSKGYGEFDDLTVLPNSHLVIDQEAPLPLSEPGVLVWKPPLNDFAQYDRWCEMLLRDQKPCVIVFDEIGSLSKNARKADFPPNFVLLLKQGRIMEESVVVMTQEMAYMDRNIFGQMTHFLRFWLTNRYDIRESNKLMGFPERDMYRNPSHEHGFFYRKMDKPATPTYEYANYQEFLY